MKFNSKLLKHKLDQDHENYTNHQNNEGVIYLESMIERYNNSLVDFNKIKIGSSQILFNIFDIKLLMAQAYLQLADFIDLNKQLSYVDSAEQLYKEAKLLLEQNSQKSTEDEFLEANMLVVYCLDKINYNRAIIYIDIAKNQSKSDNQLYHLDEAQKHLELFQNALNNKYKSIEIQKNLEIDQEFIDDVNLYLETIRIEKEKIYLKIIRTSNANMLLSLIHKSSHKRSTEAAELDEIEEEPVKRTKKNKCHVINDDDIHTTSNKNSFFSYLSHQQPDMTAILNMMEQYGNMKRNQVTIQSKRYYQLNKAAGLLLSFELKLIADKQPLVYDCSISPCVALAAFFFYRSASILFPEAKIYKQLNDYYFDYYEHFKQLIASNQFLTMSKDGMNIFRYFQNYGFSYDFSEFLNKTEQDTLKLSFQFLAKYLSTSQFVKLIDHFTTNLEISLEHAEQTSSKRPAIK